MYTIYYVRAYVYVRFYNVAAACEEGKVNFSQDRKTVRSVHILLVKFQWCVFLESVEHIPLLIVGAQNNGFKCFYHYVFIVV